MYLINEFGKLEGLISKLENGLINEPNRVNSNTYRLVMYVII